MTRSATASPGRVLLAALILAPPLIAGAADIPSRVSPQRLAAARALVTAAEQEAQRLQTDQDRRALRNLARAQAKVGDVAAAQRTLAGVPVLPDTRNTLFVVHEIAAAQAAAGDTTAALKTVRSHAHPFLQAQALEGVVRAQVARGQVADALNTAVTTIPGDPSVAARLSVLVAKTQAEGGDLAGAVRTARSIAGASGDVELEMFVAATQAQSGDLTAALATAHAITNPKRFFLNPMLAAYQAKAGDAAAAVRIAEEVPANVRFGLRELGLYGVAVTQANQGDLAGARRTAQRITEPSMQQLALAAIAAAHGRTDVAGGTALAQSLTTAEARVFGLRAIAATRALRGDVPAALRIAAAVPDARDRGGVLIAVARVQAEQGDAAGAWTTATAILDTEAREQAQKTVALVLARAGDPARLLEIGRLQASDYWRTIVLAQAAEDVMKSDAALSEPGVFAFLPPELRRGF